jgi:hypothetical protein
MGAFVGRVLAHQFGGPFAMPHRPDPQQWRVISPGLEEGIGRSGAGRVTHVIDGALSIATHVFFRPDMVIPQINGEANSIDVELAADSGTLLIQVGQPPVQAIQLRPGAFRASVSGANWTPAPSIRTFRLQGEDGRLILLAGAQRVDVGTFRSGRLELSSEDDWARITRIAVQDLTGENVFSADFRNHGPSRTFLDNATVLGALFGLLLVWGMTPLSWGAAASTLCSVAPIFLVMVLPRDLWLQGVERLYLSRMPPSDLALFSLAMASVPLFVLALTKLVRFMAQQAVNRSPFLGGWLWLSLAVGASGSTATLHGGSVLAWSVVWVCMGTGALDAVRRAPPIWWLIDSFAWVLLVFLGPDQGAIVLVGWRLIGVLGTTGLWLKTSPRVAVFMLVVATLSLPVAAESWMRSTSLNDSWQRGRLSGERPNEKGWETPVSGWTGRCGEDNAPRAVSVVVAGGSSVGGAYQFGGEPQAFFTAKAHEALCRDLPADVRLTTHNFGDGDRNTYTISRTIDAHLESADILVMYVGVNDVFTTQNTMTRKEREERASGVQESSEWLPQWVRESRLAVGLSLWFRPRPDLKASQVADVPLADAKDNHQMISDAAQRQGDRVMLLTEYVSSAQRNRLFSYAQMQQSMGAKDVQWADASAAFVNMDDKDALVDSNHLSREGNVRLGDFLAVQIKDWVYGSSR